MIENPQVQHFCRDLDALFNRYRDEYDLSNAEVIGVLQMKLHLLCTEVIEDHDDTTNDEDSP